MGGKRMEWHRPLAWALRRDAWATFSGEAGNACFCNEVLC